MQTHLASGSTLRCRRTLPQARAKPFASPLLLRTSPVSAESDSVAPFRPERKCFVPFPKVLVGAGQADSHPASLASLSPAPWLLSTCPERLIFLAHSVLSPPRSLASSSRHGSPPAPQPDSALCPPDPAGREAFSFSSALCDSISKMTWHEPSP